LVVVVVVMIGVVPMKRWRSMLSSVARNLSFQSATRRRSREKGIWGICIWDRAVMAAKGGKRRTKNKLVTGTLTPHAAREYQSPQHSRYDEKDEEGGVHEEEGGIRMTLVISGGGKKG
jgi:hypothetical protein